MYNKKSYLKKLVRIRAGTYRKSDSGLFLDRNERSTPLNNKIKQDLKKRLSKINLGQYPDLEKFYIKLSKWIKLPRNQIYLTEGVSGGIKSLVETLTVPGKSNIIFPTPTFALYPVYCKMFNIKIKNISYDLNYNLKLDNILQLIDNNTAVIFIPNPNMPIEGMLKYKDILKLAKICNKKKIILAIDEVYYPFSNFTVINLIKKFNNVLIMRSFSKAFGLAGIRLGYILGNKNIIDYISKTRTGYETNSLSVETASFFIDNYDLVLNYVSKVKSGLSFLKNELDKNKIEYNGGTYGNYIFINLKNPSLVNKVVNRLIKKNIYVRGNWPKPFNSGFSVSGAPINKIKIFYSEFLKIIN